MHAIKLENVTKTYPCAPAPAVRNVSLEVPEGSIVTILGPSGYGKTTTLHLIAGFERPDRGRIFLAGRTVSDVNSWVPPEKRGIGMVFQDYALFPHLDVFHNVGFGYRGKDRKARVLEMLDLVDLAGYGKRAPHELSGGQQQRVALARALARRPVVVMLDEPFSNLDAELRGTMRLEVKRIIKETGTTAILVSHDQKDALAISDNIVVMKEGVVQQRGTPREIYRLPENKFVATFVGRSNILKGVIARDSRSLETGLGVIPCRHTHGHKPGEEVYISIRPDSLEMSGEGPLTGSITRLTYTGDAYEAEVEVEDMEGKRLNLLAHIHPERSVAVGDSVRFKILPEFVAVMRP